MENDFFSPFTKIKNKKKRQKLNKMCPTLGTYERTRLDMYNHTQIRALRLAPAPADAQREKKFILKNFSYSWTWIQFFNLQA